MIHGKFRNDDMSIFEILLLNCFAVDEITTSSERTFQGLTTLDEKKYFRVLDKSRGMLSLSE